MCEPHRPLQSPATGRSLVIAGAGGWRCSSVCLPLLRVQTPRARREDGEIVHVGDLPAHLGRHLGYVVTQALNVPGTRWNLGMSHLGDVTRWGILSVGARATALAAAGDGVAL